MSGKRGAEEQITRENFHSDDDSDSGPSGPARASAEVLAKRKILKPRGRLGKPTPSASMSSGFAFNSKPAESTDKPNPFSGFGQTQAPAASNPFGSFAPPKPQTQEDDKPKANPFGFLKKDEPKEETSKAQNVFSFINNNNNDSDTSLVSTKSTEKSTEKASKIKALNDNFYTKITQERTANPVSNFTPILRKYIDYYDQIDRDIEIPDADADDQPEEQKALPAPAPAPVQKQTFNFGNATPPTFNFGQTQQQQPQVVESESSREPTPMDETKDNSKEAIVVDVESNSDSDDDIKVEGPKFTLAKPPTTSDSVFKLTPDATKSTASSGSGPTFTFAGTSTKFDNPFKLTKPEEKKEEEKKEEKKETSGFGSTNNFSWSPGQPVKFGAPSSTTPSKEESTDKPKFNFGGFGQTAEKKDEENPKPAFTFGAASTTTEPAKPAFNFGSNTSTDSGSKPAFNFGSNSSTTKPAFNFGGNTDSSASKPTFNFGGSSTAPSFGSSTFNFSMGGAKPAEAPTKTDGGDDDKVPEEEAKVDFKPVVELKEKIEEKTGEEDEELLYTKRSKLMLFAPQDEKGPYVSKGLGELKVLKHKETGKSRILVRADGSNRVILNTAVTKQFKYTAEGKGHVKVPTIGGEGKLETYLIKVKTDEDAKNLVQALTDAQT